MKLLKFPTIFTRLWMEWSKNSCYIQYLSRPLASVMKEQEGNIAGVAQYVQAKGRTTLAGGPGACTFTVFFEWKESEPQNKQVLNAKLCLSTNYCSSEHVRKM